MFFKSQTSDVGAAEGKVPLKPVMTNTPCLLLRSADLPPGMPQNSLPEPQSWREGCLSLPPPLKIKHLLSTADLIMYLSLSSFTSSNTACLLLRSADLPPGKPQNSLPEPQSWRSGCLFWPLPLKIKHLLSSADL